MLVILTKQKVILLILYNVTIFVKNIYYGSPAEIQTAHQAIYQGSSRLQLWKEITQSCHYLDRRIGL